MYFFLIFFLDFFYLFQLPPQKKDFDPTNMNYASQCHSHTIAFIIYMCVRYADKIDYEKMVCFLK